jgi:DnaJ-like protein
MASDHYAILGVTPQAEAAVIRAAYRALIRRYHPDTNPDPVAQEKAREITAAFKVLSNPERRAEYDRERFARIRGPADLPPRAERAPPPMRAPAIAAAILAFVLSFGVWMSQKPQFAVQKSPMAPAAAHVSPVPVVELEPESERLARLHAQSGVVATDRVPSDPGPPDPQLEAVADAPVPGPVLPSRTVPSRRPAPPVRLAAHAAPEVIRPAEAVPIPATAPRTNDRIATLDRLARGFFSQSMVHAPEAKQQLLISSRDRAAATRTACHSDACVSDAYLRQMREISAIMEGRSLPQP